MQAKHRREMQRGGDGDTERVIGCEKNDTHTAQNLLVTHDSCSFTYSFPRPGPGSLPPARHRLRWGRACRRRYRHRCRCSAFRISRSCASRGFLQVPNLNWSTVSISASEFEKPSNIIFQGCAFPRCSRTRPRLASSPTLSPCWGGN